MKLASRVENNIKLLLDDAISGIQRRQSKPYLDKERFKTENRREVLHLYRHMLKNIPPMFERKLERIQNYEHIKFLFREGSREDDEESIKFLKNTAYTVIEKINKGVYPPFPKFQV
jgi:hypothetical protein